MNLARLPRHPLGALLTLLLLGVAPPACAWQAAVPDAGKATADVAAADASTLLLPAGEAQVEVRLLDANVVRLRVAAPHDAAPAATVVLDPRAQWPDAVPARRAAQDGIAQLATAALRLRWDAAHHLLTLEDAAQHRLLQLDPRTLARGAPALVHAPGDALYGIHGYDAFEHAGGLLRHGDLRAHAGKQGMAGAPFAWSTAGYGVLADAVGVRFDLAGDRLALRGEHGPVRDLYLIAGDPHAIFAALARLSGPTPLFPKWAMGFNNSQWGIDQAELLGIVEGYRTRHIPLDNVVLDFDWKAWGEDDYGEFRWNPAKFPGGPDGSLKRTLDARGVRLTGIMKPRIHVDTVEGREATVHDYWLAQGKARPDYFSHQSVREIDFAQPAARAWFFNDALRHAYATGIAGWWNDEADDSGVDTQHLDMQRALYEGQLAAFPNRRVWSINRNFYLGAQRYAYGLWSGDIATGFPSMAGQRQRMLSAVNLGAMQWGMDGGGYKGTPTPENYARWIEFGAFTPVFRVHGELGQKRQPWRFGPVAERAAADAIRLRYALLPYVYSYEWRRRTSGVGLVRPLLFDWPHDPKVRDSYDAWLFGDYLLAAPVVEPGQTHKRLYLPAGQWTDWSSGRRYAGGQAIDLAVDATGWRDIPLFVREGAIIPMQPPMDYAGERALEEVTVEVFPAEAASRFDYYDDDGESYDYEQGAYFLQTLGTRRQGRTVVFDAAAPQGRFRPALARYLLRIHGPAATSVAIDGRALAAAAGPAALARQRGEGWATGQDRYGPVTYVRLAAGSARHVELSAGE
ncbi:TIM-barrel domain-containing protein [Frateuria defendens]|uniref:glycoside hydrolase family 31 protein n=1 Tax=Frateuria defendens TaxID=2219559 RepID=UPI0009E4BCE7|nr:TIM-barrel domain-containing protein [Frateuria defendens]